MLAITNLSELKKLLKLLREQGVETFTIGDMSFKLGDLPAEPSEYVEESQDPYANFPTGDLSPEQLIYYATGGEPNT